MPEDLKKIKDDILSLKRKQRFGKITATITSLFLIGSIGYTIKLTFDKAEQEVVITKVINEKQKIIADLGIFKEKYDRISEENIAVTEELEAERLKVIQFLKEVEETEEGLKYHENRYRQLDNKILSLTRDNQRLEAVNTELTRKIDSLKALLSSKTNISLDIPSKQEVKDVPVEESVIVHVVSPKETKYAISKKYNISPSELIQQNPHVEKMLREGDTLRILTKNSAIDALASAKERRTKLHITNANIYEEPLTSKASEEKTTKLATKEKSAKLSVSSLDVYAVQVKSSGKENKTDKAKNANKIKIEFTFAQNEYTPNEPKTYYIQVIDEQKNILSKSGQVRLGSQTLHYTFVRTFDHDNPNVKISEQIELNEPEKGMYFVYIFDQNKMIASKRIILD